MLGGSLLQVVQVDRVIDVPERPHLVLARRQMHCVARIAYTRWLALLALHLRPLPLRPGPGWSATRAWRHRWPPSPCDRLRASPPVARRWPAPRRSARRVAGATLVARGAA